MSRRVVRMAPSSPSEIAFRRFRVADTEQEIAAHDQRSRIVRHTLERLIERRCRCSQVITLEMLLGMGDKCAHVLGNRYRNGLSWFLARYVGTRCNPRLVPGE